MNNRLQSLAIFMEDNLGWFIVLDHAFPLKGGGYLRTRAVTSIRESGRGIEDFRNQLQLWIKGHQGGIWHGL